MDQLLPKLHDVLSTVRALYVQELAEAIRNQPGSLVEPALRMEDGKLATEGTPSTPYRADLIPRDSGETTQIDSTRRLTFRETSFKLHGFVLRTASFFWDCANFRVIGATDLDINLIATWFNRWFDPEDQREPDEAGLHGVVHSMSNVEVSDDDWIFQIDFGSAPVEAFTDLIASLESAGARSVEVS